MAHDDTDSHARWCVLDHWAVLFSLGQPWHPKRLLCTLVHPDYWVALFLLGQLWHPNLKDSHVHWCFLEALFSLGHTFLIGPAMAPSETLMHTGASWKHFSHWATLFLLSQPLHPNLTDSCATLVLPGSTFLSGPHFSCFLLGQPLHPNLKDSCAHWCFLEALFSVGRTFLVRPAITP
jgi:hypothetical protein